MRIDYPSGYVSLVNGGTAKAAEVDQSGPYEEQQ